MSDIQEAAGKFASSMFSAECQGMANDLLLRWLFTERAESMGITPHEAQRQVGLLVTSVTSSNRRGMAGEEERIERVAELLEEFGETLANRLRDREGDTD